MILDFATNVCKRSGVEALLCLDPVVQTESAELSLTGAAKSVSGFSFPKKSRSCVTPARLSI